MAAVDETKLNDFLGRFVADLGATANAAMVVIGHRLGLYRALADASPLTAAELAERSRHHAPVPHRVARRPGRLRICDHGQRGPVHPDR